MVQPVEQPDELLPDTVVNQLSRDFAKKYNLTIDTWLEPCDTLRSRVYREWKKQTMTGYSAGEICDFPSRAQAAGHCHFEWWG